MVIDSVWEMSLRAQRQLSAIRWMLGDEWDTLRHVAP